MSQRCVQRVFRVAGIMAISLALGSGCVSMQRYGTTPVATEELVAQGAPEGDVISRHGAPDQVIHVYEGPAFGEEGAQVERYLLVYRIVEGASFATIYSHDRFTNICYMIENGKVAGAGIAPTGEGTSILYGDRFYPHPRTRSGHGGDGRTDPSGLGLTPEGEH